MTCFFISSGKTFWSESFLCISSGKLLFKLTCSVPQNCSLASWNNLRTHEYKYDFLQAIMYMILVYLLFSSGHCVHEYYYTFCFLQAITYMNIIIPSVFFRSLRTWILLYFLFSSGQFLREYYYTFCFVQVIAYMNIIILSVFFRPLRTWIYLASTRALVAE